MKILFTGGGSGGHIFPIIALAREIRRIFTGKKLQFFYVGPKDDFGEILLSQEGIKVKTILAGKIRRYLNWQSFLQNIGDVLFKVPAGIFQAFFQIFFLAPDLILAKGGFGSLPGTMAGWLFGIPIFLHESDVAPGLANKFLSRLARKIFVSFPKTEYFSPKKMILTGNPIRKEILDGSKEEALKLFKIIGAKPIILILGGSQGAQRINDVILEILPKLINDFEIIHQCGENNFKEVRAEARAMIASEQGKYYHPQPFLNEIDLKQAYALADFIISRAGSGSIFEIAVLGKPSILVPLPESAQNHQVKNAYAFAENGAAIVMEEENFTPHFFLEKLKNLFSHSEELDKMAKAAKEFSRPAAAKTIAEYLLKEP